MSGDVDFNQIFRDWSDIAHDHRVNCSLFTMHAERLLGHARSLAQQLQVVNGVGRPSKRHVVQMRLVEDSDLLHKLYLTVSDTLLKETGAASDTPAAEAFVDNWHIIEDHLVSAQQNLSDNQRRPLPILSSGVLRGYPRVHAISLGLVLATDAALTENILTSFIRSYQEVTPLLQDELHTLPISLSIVLVEHLRVVAERVHHTVQQQHAAEALIERLRAQAASSSSPRSLKEHMTTSLTDSHRQNPNLTRQLAIRLQDDDAFLQFAKEWLQRHLLDEDNANIADVIHTQRESQEADLATVQSLINSMRLLNDISWTGFVEDVSIVHQLLREDPAGLYEQMNFATRDAYWRAVKRLSAGSQTTELDVATLVVQLSQAKAKDRGERSQRHVGYWLMGPGTANLEASLSYTRGVSESLLNLVRCRPTLFYFCATAVLTGFAITPALLYASAISGLRLDIQAVFLVLLLVPTSQLAVCFATLVFHLTVPATLLPAMRMDQGIPSTALTIVAVSTQLTTSKHILDTLHRLEVEFLANKDDSLHFALLVDPADSDNQTTEEDQAFTSLTRKNINALNHKYPSLLHRRFHVFQRQRTFYAHKGMWSARDGKSGQRREFFRLLRCVAGTSFVDVEDPSGLLAKIMYVIVLDSGTSLGRNSARALVGIITHPLNAPRFDSLVGAVADGYGALLPSVVTDLTSSTNTRFSQLQYDPLEANDPPSSDHGAYYDAFSDRESMDQGLYVVDAFLSVEQHIGPTHGPVDTVATRAAFITGVNLYDSINDWDSARRARGQRLQEIYWSLTCLYSRLCHRIPFLRLRSELRRLNLLRRALVNPAQALCFILAWTAMRGNAWQWTLQVLLTLALPVYSSTICPIHEIRYGPAQAQATNRRLWRNRLWVASRTRSVRLVVQLSFLMDLLVQVAEPLTRAVRIPEITRKKGVWKVDAKLEAERRSCYWSRFLAQPGPAAAILLALVILFHRPWSLFPAFPFLVLWALSPWTALYLSAPLPMFAPLTATQRVAFRAYCRRTWHFFETFITPASHHLAPDNVQEEADTVVAHRTSPTNIGLQMLATISASDLGFIGKWQCLEMIERTMDAMAGLDRWNGHLFNWYDTETMRPLLPKYVSTVDSGNLACFLLAVQQWCEETTAPAEISMQSREGLADTLRQLASEVDQAFRLVTADTDRDCLQQVRKGLDKTISMTKGSTSTCEKHEWGLLLQSVNAASQNLAGLLNSLSPDSATAPYLEDCHTWMRLVCSHISELQRDFSTSTISRAAYCSRKAAAAAQCRQLFSSMDFKVMYSVPRKLFVIGYNVTDDKFDPYHFDMLASESRLASFAAVCKGDVADDHWHMLSRHLTCTGGHGQALISWTASMFEYLMPLIVMRPYQDTALGATYGAVVARQIEYGKVHGVPWGISEAGYNARDQHKAYLYGPFGVPGLGLKRGLSKDLVISPYSTMLAAMVDPASALANLEALQSLDVFGRYGFYESIDYTSTRLEEGEKCAVLHSYMVHHQGMGLSSLSNALNDGIMQSRFHTHPLVQATQPLLLERVPSDAVFSLPRADEVHLETICFFSSQPAVCVPGQHPSCSPRSQLESTGNDRVLVTSCGPGCSKCGAFPKDRGTQSLLSCSASTSAMC